MTAPHLSVIICTHNAREDYLGRCIGALHGQSLAKDQWELVVVDNLSDAPLAPRIDLGWHPRAWIVREETLGLTPARLRGIRETGGEILVFVDDDNVLDPDYLETALAVARDKPFLGAWSGQCRPTFETKPPAWTRRYWGNLCIRMFDNDAWSNLPRMAETMPAGAGLCVRRLVALRYVELHERGVRAIQLDRTGGSLLSGGDQDLAACASDFGLGLGLIARLKLDHLIPPERLTAMYLTRLSEGITLSGTLLDAYWGQPVAAKGILGSIADAIRIMRLRSPHNKILKASHRGRAEALRLLSKAAPRTTERPPP